VVTAIKKYAFFIFKDAPRNQITQNMRF